MEYNRKIDGFTYYVTPSKNASEETGTERRVDVYFSFKSGEEVFTNTLSYKDVPVQRVDKAVFKIDDFTIYNQQQTSMTSVIPLLTIIHEAERIIFDEK